MCFVTFIREKKKFFREKRGPISAQEAKMMHVEFF